VYLKLNIDITFQSLGLGMVCSLYTSAPQEHPDFYILSDRDNGLIYFANVGKEAQAICHGGITE
jgi:hypothetical protein